MQPSWRWLQVQKLWESGALIRLTVQRRLAAMPQQRREKPCTSRSARLGKVSDPSCQCILLSQETASPPALHVKTVI